MGQAVHRNDGSVGQAIHRNDGSVGQAVHRIGSVGQAVRRIGSVGQAVRRIGSRSQAYTFVSWLQVQPVPRGLQRHLFKVRTTSLTSENSRTCLCYLVKIKLGTEKWCQFGGISSSVVPLLSSTLFCSVTG